MSPGRRTVHGPEDMLHSIFIPRLNWSKDLKEVTYGDQLRG